MNILISKQLKFNIIPYKCSAFSLLYKKLVKLLPTENMPANEIILSGIPNSLHQSECFLQDIPKVVTLMHHGFLTLFYFY